jgi:hypothetical protein
MKIEPSDSSILKLSVGSKTLTLHKRTGYLQVSGLDAAGIVKIITITPDEFPDFLSAMRTCMNSHKTANATKESEVQNPKTE